MVIAAIRKVSKDGDTKMFGLFKKKKDEDVAANKGETTDSVTAEVISDVEPLTKDVTSVDGTPIDVMPFSIGTDITTGTETACMNVLSKGQSVPASRTNEFYLNEGSKSIGYILLKNDESCDGMIEMDRCVRVAEIFFNLPSGAKHMESVSIEVSAGTDGILAVTVESKEQGYRDTVRFRLTDLAELR